LLTNLYPRGVCKQAISSKMARDSAESAGCTLYYYQLNWWKTINCIWTMKYLKRSVK